MPKKELLYNQRDALSSMLRDRGIEVYTYDDIDKLIHAELDKNAEDIDADLIDELVQLKLELDASGTQSSIMPAPARGKHRRTGLRKVAIVLVLLLTLSIAVMGVASAFNWADLVRVFAPIFETMGIQLNLDEVRDDNVYENSGVMENSLDDADEWPEVESVLVEQESDMPDMLRGYSVKPQWIPEGYHFNYGDVFDHPVEANAIWAYTNGETEVFVGVTVYAVGVDVSTYDVEWGIDIEASRASYEDGIQIIEDYGTITATWIDEVAYYMVWGKLPREDILSIITSIKGVG